MELVSIMGRKKDISNITVFVFLCVGFVFFALGKLVIGMFFFVLAIIISFISNNFLENGNTKDDKI